MVVWRTRRARAEPSLPAESTPEGASSPAEPAAPPPERRVARIGRSITIRGDVSADEDLVLEGRVDGQVAVPNHHLTIGPDTEHVQAELAARAVTIHGRVVGKVVAIERVEIAATGRIEGSVVAPRLRVHEGGLLNGAVTMRSAEAQVPLEAVGVEAGTAS